MLPVLSRKAKAPYLNQYNKLFYVKLFKNLFLTTYSIRFWDGEEVIFGDEDIMARHLKTGLPTLKTQWRK